jgi:hypothetical protein
VKSFQIHKVSVTSDLERPEVEAVTKAACPTAVRKTAQPPSTDGNFSLDDHQRGGDLNQKADKRLAGVAT